MKILIINGPNLDKLKLRDPEQYGVIDFDKIVEDLKLEFTTDKFEMEFRSSEGGIIDLIHGASSYFDGIILNPGGYSHTSVAIRDAIEISKVPIVEVHLSNIAAREDFRKISLTAAKCEGYISGFKHFSYFAGVYLLHKLAKSN